MMDVGLLDDIEQDAQITIELREALTMCAGQIEIWVRSERERCSRIADLVVKGQITAVEAASRIRQGQ